MRAASDKQHGECKRFLNSTPPPAPGPLVECVRHLSFVADTFVQAQHRRQSADYDNSKQWRRLETLTLISEVEEAFASWRAIREQPVAQAYLISLLGNPKGA